MRTLIAKLFPLLSSPSAYIRPARKACHCSIVFLRRTLHLFRFLKTFIIKSFPSRETKTGIAPPFSFSF